jgi:predicted RNase H-like HicB family nuclease
MAQRFQRHSVSSSQCSDGTALPLPVPVQPSACLQVRAVPWVSGNDQVVFVVSAGLTSDSGPGAGLVKGLVEVSDTYTAVYERDGEAWVVQIAEEPQVHGRGLSPGEARKAIRDALAEWLGVDSAELRITDDFRLPTQIRAAQQRVKATRTEHDRNQMMASMTDSRSAMSWAEDLDISMRDPVTVQALMDLGDREISVDTFCHIITMTEELSRLTATADRFSSDPREQD